MEKSNLEAKLEIIIPYLKKNLSREKLSHSLAVAKVAQKIARITLGINPEKAYLAGIIHDLAREIPEAKLIELAKNHRLKIDSFTQKKPILLHAPIGAKLAHKLFNINDSEILQAVEKHCIPKVNMEHLDKIIYLADTVAEITNPKDNLYLKKILSIIKKESIDKALFYIYNEGIKHFIQTGARIHPDLIKARNKFLENWQKKVLILGSKGMLGFQLMRAFKDYKLTGLDKSEIDITNKKYLEQKILNLKPDIIINAAAYTNVEEAESRQEFTIKTNGKAVGYLAQIAKKINAVLIHYSTDYVFDGKNRKGYRESAQPNPINVYGKSKFLGEALLRRAHNRYYLIRSSWMFGQNGQNFVDKILQIASANAKITVVNDQWGKPTFTQDLAYRTKQLVEQEKPFGIYHITNEGKTNWHQLARRAIELKGLKVKITPIESSQYKTSAKRPICSVLVNTKLPKLRHWEEALQEYLISK